MLNQHVQIESAKQDLLHKKPKQAFLKLMSISNIYSNSKEYLVLMAEVLLQLNDREGYLKSLKTLSRQFGDVDNNLRYAVNLVQDGQYNLALDVVQKVSVSDLNYVQFIKYCHCLIQIHIAANDYEGIEELLVTMDSRSVVTEYYYYGKSILMLNLGMEAHALGYLRESVLLNPRFIQGWISLSMIHDKMGDLDLAIANVEKALDIDPENQVALKMFFKLEEKTGVLHRAIEKLHSYMDKYQFDGEIGEHCIQALTMASQNDIAQCEAEKLFYFHGKSFSS